MIVIDDYTIEQYPGRNSIVITMPQTFTTIQSTSDKVVDRRVCLTQNELTAILVAVKGMFEYKGKKDE